MSLVCSYIHMQYRVNCVVFAFREMMSSLSLSFVRSSFYLYLIRFCDRNVMTFCRSQHFPYFKMPSLWLTLKATMFGSWNDRQTEMFRSAITLPDTHVNEMNGDKGAVRERERDVETFNRIHYHVHAVNIWMYVQARDHAHWKQITSEPEL